MRKPRNRREVGHGQHVHDNHDNFLYTAILHWSETNRTEGVASRTFRSIQNASKAANTPAAPRTTASAFRKPAASLLLAGSVPDDPEPLPPDSDPDPDEPEPEPEPDPDPEPLDPLPLVAPGLPGVVGVGGTLMRIVLLPDTETDTVELPKLVGMLVVD